MRTIAQKAKIPPIPPFTGDYAGPRHEWRFFMNQPLLSRLHPQEWIKDGYNFRLTLLPEETGTHNLRGITNDLPKR